MMSTDKREQNTHPPLPVPAFCLLALSFLSSALPLGAQSVSAGVFSLLVRCHQLIQFYFLGVSLSVYRSILSA